MKKNSSSAICIVLLVILTLCAITLTTNGNTANTLPYSDFEQKWNDNDISSIVYNENKMMIEGLTLNQI